MSEELHETHRWGERGGVPYCRDCSVEGYEDEPGAFAECPGPPLAKTLPCSATMWSLDDPGHLHECMGGHRTGDHMCRYPDCRRWFGPR